MAGGKFSKLLFKPSVKRSLDRGEVKVSNVTLAGQESLTDEGFHFSTSSFRYDPPGVALKNVQQLNIDFSKLENHTFFNSAEAKTQSSFDKIVNQFPFDGTKKELIEFKDRISGYDKYVYDRFPKNTGFLSFQRSRTNLIQVEDYAGASDLVLNESKGKGQSILDPTGERFTVEFYLHVPNEIHNGNEVIFQRRGEDTTVGIGANAKYFGVTVALSSSAPVSNGLNECSLHAMLSSGSFGVDTKTNLLKGVWNHFAIVFGQDNADRLSIYKNGELVSSSSVGSFGFGSVSSPLTIASGSRHESYTFSFLPSQTFSGSIDELRFWHAARTQNEIRHFQERNCFAHKDLRLYYRFNEPSGSFGTTERSGNESLILDSSGNGFHVKASNFHISQRNTSLIGTASSPLSLEDSANCPILFPSFHSVITLNEELLSSASNYDYNNPNLITKMIPNHYFQEASVDEGFATDKGNIGDVYGYNNDQPGGGKPGQPQIIAALLYVMAAELDDLKLFASELARLIRVDVNKQGTISEQFLPFLARYYGMTLPSSFANASIQQLKDSDGISLDRVLSNLGLQKIQNTIWRRILSDLPELLKSRGTRHCLESLFRDMGIEPNGLFRIREYGGSRRRKIGDTFEKRHEIAAMLDFSGSLAATGTIDASGVDSARPLFRTDCLYAKRTEPGVPMPRGTFVDGVSNNLNDFLLTSGSWSAEGVFKFGGTSHLMKQSLFRMQTTGSTLESTANNFLIYNVVATPPSTIPRVTGSLFLYGRPASGSSASTLKMVLTGVDVYDGKKWHVSFGRTRNDFAGSAATSSYFFRAGKMSAGRLTDYYAANAGFVDDGNTILNTISSSNNSSGSFLAIGSQSLIYDSTTRLGHLNSYSESAAQTVNFTGKVSGIRFFSKALTEKETLTHIRNFKSLGVEKPALNFNFNTKDSGSFERLRLDVNMDQPLTQSLSNSSIRLFDFSQNMFHASGSGFEPSKRVIKPERFDYEILSPRFELAVATNKVRIRSWKNPHNIKKYGGDIAPLFEIPQMDQPRDDRRLAIEVSCVQALNEDIVNIFATLDAYDNALGAPELVFSHEYRDLRNLRKIYFNRLQDKLSLEKFFRFYKWFDDTVGDVIEEFLPSSTNYLGTNFVIESHALERSKFVYNYSDMYIGEIDRLEEGSIYLQQYIGIIRKF